MPLYGKCTGVTTTSSIKPASSSVKPTSSSVKPSSSVITSTVKVSTTVKASTTVKSSTIKSSSTKSTSATASPSSYTTLTDCLGVKGVPIKLASSSDWSSYEATFNTRLQYVPSVIVVPTTAQHVSDAVICAGQFNVKVQAKVCLSRPI